mgnify:CR=1 FL=1
MATKTIDAALLQKLFLAAAANLEANKESINDLNVFPVPDGDTGTNMTLTIMSAAKEVGSLESPSMGTLSKAIAGGSLRGARGNSGVILSQLLRGFTKVVRDFDYIDKNNVVEAFNKAVETAYKAVMKPKEGTILTVARGMAEKIEEIAPGEDDLEVIFKEVIVYGNSVLDETPELLPVLKQAGVVDSGGKGLMTALEGAYDALTGKTIDYSSFKTSKPKINLDSVTDHVDISAQGLEVADLEFGYCTEFIVNIENGYTEKEEEEFRDYLLSIGNSLVLVSDDDYIKIHVHTNHPGLAFEKGLTYGSLTRMKVDNMREENKERVEMNVSKVMKSEMDSKASAPKENAEPAAKYGFVSVSAGDGLSEIFKSLGVDYIIEGGQTMNPSTEDILSAVEKVNAENIFILPNNSNIILAANQAQSIEENKNILVVPTKSIPQGIASMIAFSEDAEPDANLETMKEELKAVKSGSVTYAVRDTELDGKIIKENDIMGIGDKTILSVGNDIAETTKDMISQLVDDDSELISLYYGADVSEEDAQKLCDEIAEAYPKLDVELNAGGQPIYYYILSVE